MNFFEQQDQAHRESKKLLFLFFIAVVAIVVAVNFSLAMVWLWTKGGHGAIPRPYPQHFFLITSLATLAVIGGGSLFQMMQLRDGGDAVAEMAGGRLVDPNSRDLQERRLLNVVEEMALAAGIACPKVYILDEEDAINAFAAGYHQNEAVVAVTRGTLSRLSRDELQGVIGHEFSHIMNGDMRMNVKLIGILFGIQMISGLGQILLDWGSRFGSSRSRDEKGPSIQLVMLALGAALFAIGYIGIFCGRLIKAAVSRQREFLADASSVQFTRNPDGIGGALRKIGGLTRENDCGSRIRNPNAEQLSHMFLGAAKPSLLSGLFATHPPIETRLQRVYGKSVSFLDASELPEEANSDLTSNANAMGFAGAGAAASASAFQSNKTVSDTGFGAHAGAAVVTNGVSEVDAVSNVIPTDIRNAARSLQAVPALMYAMLLDRRDEQAYQVQIDILKHSVPQTCALATLLMEMLAPLSRSVRLPILDLATPALRALDLDQKSQLMGIVARLIAADNKVTQAEFVLQTVLERRLNAAGGRAVAIRYSALSQLKAEAALLLSLMAQTHGANAATMFLHAAQSQADLALQSNDYVSEEKVDYFDVKQALTKVNQLAPLAKPFMIRLLLQAVGSNMSDAAADLLRTICAAIDSPVPEQVSARYTVN